MDWNKDNPRFRRSPLTGGRGRKSGKLFGVVGRKLNHLFSRLKKSGQTEESPHRPKPPAPVELFEELKIAVPKSRKFPGSRGVRRRRPLADAVCPPPRTEGDASETPETSRPDQERSAPAAVSASGSIESGQSDQPEAAEKKPEATSAEQSDSDVDRPGREDAADPPASGTQESEDADPTPEQNSRADSSSTPVQRSRPSAGNGQATDRRAVGRLPRPKPASTSETEKSRQADSAPVPAEDSAALSSGPAEKTDSSPADDDRPAAGPAEKEKCAPPRTVKRVPPLGAASRSLSGPSQDKSAPALLARDPEPIEVFSPPTEKRKQPGKRPRRTGGSSRRVWALAALGLVLIAGAVLAGLHFFQDSAPPSAKVARIPSASLPKVAPLSPGFYERYALELENALQSEETIAPGSSLGKALENLGLGARHKVGSLIECLTGEGGVAVVRPGAVIKAFWADSEKNELKRLEYHPASGGAPIVVMARPDNSGYWRYNLSSPLLTINAAREGSINSSLWEAGTKAGLDANVIMSLADILASEVDFLTDIKKGDEFQVLYSRDYADGKAQGTPIIDMVTFKSKGKELEYYRYVNSKDRVGYYDREGRSSAKTFFVSPLQYKRISSQFTMTRLHPIHKVVRPHQGVDYAAPTGTPVSSVADGTVIFCGWNGGYGRLVTIKHDSTYTTMYAHLSSFAKDLKKGSVVKQGDLIGRVGATGTATGPHLDFRLKKNGKFIDPIPELAKQEGKKLETPEDRQAFVQVRDRIRERMKRQLAENTGGG